MSKEWAELLQKNAKLKNIYTGEIYMFNSFVNNSNLILDCKDESKNIVKLSVDSIKPIDKIRFITPRYEEIFAVNNLDSVYFVSKILQVVWYDDYHFAFFENGKIGKVWHICRFAENFNENGKMIRPAFAHGE